MLRIKKMPAVLALVAATFMIGLFADDASDVAKQKDKIEKLQKELSQEKAKNNMLQKQMRPNPNQGKIKNNDSSKNQT